MKKIFYHIDQVLVIAGVLLCACTSEIGELSSLPILEPASSDLQASQWRTVVAKKEEVNLPVPAGVNSEAYRSERAQMEAARTQLNENQRKTMEYWRAGGVQRWNEVMRHLVAKYNLPPVANADGSYPFPNPANPLAYPLFPFANPPYAARAYAYTSVAQYDALVLAWHYKELYKRPALVGDLPSYPSEDAVIASVSAAMLKLLFPGETAYIDELASDQTNAAHWAGKATQSDIEAGKLLGEQVAAQVIARARTDGAGAAAGNAALWKALEEKPMELGEIPWKSLEIPARPVMLPAFGAVNAWNLSKEEIARIRPEAPPSVFSEKMKQELEEVKYYVKNITREQLRIVHYWADGVGTYTPPGHWNAITAKAIAEKQFSEVRAARTFALVNMALMDAAICCWETKMYYFNPRPSQLDEAIKTATGVPNFPAYTSGHSTFSGSAAEVLSYIFPAQKSSFLSMAEEASLSRLYGAIHYRSDCEVGLRCGREIGSYTVRWAQEAGE